MENMNYWSDKMTVLDKFEDLENKRREYWIVEFQESRNNSIKKNYIGKIVTNEILEELKQSDNHIYIHNKMWGEDEFGNETDKWMPYSKTYFDHYKDGKVIEHVRIDIGDGVKDNNDLYQYIEESIEKINQAEALQEVTSKTKLEISKPSGKYI